MKRTLQLYFILLHLGIGLLLFKPQIMDGIANRFGPNVVPAMYRHYLAAVESQAWVSQQMATGSVVLLGDSLVENLWVGAISSRAVNFGIGGDTTVGLLQRLPRLSLKKASLIILGIGINDLPKFRDDEILDRFRSILDKLEVRPLIVSAILPVDENLFGPFSNSRIRKLNQQLKTLCQERSGILFLDIGPLLSGYTSGLSSAFHVGDGLHLNSTGSAIWCGELRKLSEK